MKILVVCQYYYPEPFRHPDFCEELVKRGHDVTVVTGIPNYPMGEIYEGYSSPDKKDELINGVKVHRCFTIPRKQGAIYRFLNYYSYAISSTLYINKIKEEYDLVFVNQLSPVMMADAAIRYKKRFNKKMALYCLDLWPESLVTGGIARGSFIYKFFHRISARIYKKADKILITSKSFADYFEKEFGIADTEYLPQYAEALFTPEQCRKEPDEYIDLMFAGNLGAAQDVGTVIEAARLTADNKSIRWHIVGDGSEYANLQKQAEGLDNVIFYGRKPLEEMPAFYAMADAMLVTMQADPIISLTLPGKVQTYMAAGKPIIGAVDGEAAKIIAESGCGACCPSGDYKALAQLALDFDRQKMQTAAEKSLEYYDEFFKKERFLERLTACFADIASSDAAAK